MDVVSFACKYSSHVVCLPFVQINLFTLPFALSELTFVSLPIHIYAFVFDSQFLFFYLSSESYLLALF